MIAAIHNCRFCGGQRPHNGVDCLGCGSDIASCKPIRIRRNNQDCPKCTHSGPHSVITAHRRRCVKYGAVFEAVDFGFVDTRPEVNLAKIERAESEARKRARKQ